MDPGTVHLTYGVLNTMNSDLLLGLHTVFYILHCRELFDFGRTDAVYSKYFVGL